MKYLPLIVVLCHTALIACFAAAVRTSIVMQVGKGPEIWKAFLLLDCPVSMIVSLILSARSHHGYFVDVYGTAIAYLIAGGCQYYFITWWLIDRRSKRHAMVKSRGTD